jgi:hypothetical protein
MGKESPREHVKMRHDPRLGQQPRIGVAGVPAPSDYRRHSRPISHHQASSPMTNAAVPHLNEIANNDRKRREKGSQQGAHLHRDSRHEPHHRSGSGRDRSNGNHLQQPQGSSHLARVSASIPAPVSPLRKLSEPVVLNGRPEDLDVLANELNRMGRLPNSTSAQPSGSISPPPPAPPARNTSILISMDGHSNGIDGTLLASEPASVSAPANVYHSDGTLRGKPLPPTPDSEEPGDGTLMIRKHSRNGSQSGIRRNNSGSISDLPSAINGGHNRLSIVGKAASVPDVSLICVLEHSDNYSANLMLQQESLLYPHKYRPHIASHSPYLSRPISRPTTTTAIPSCSPRLKSTRSPRPLRRRAAAAVPTRRPASLRASCAYSKARPSRPNRQARPPLAAPTRVSAPNTSTATGLRPTC